MPKWTEEQQQAINLENTNILVSAGAGSGKTAVLSERALRKVKEGTNIDEILILTFTKAAAYEMMLRIRDKIQKNGLREQVNRIDKAYITTFDSFALSMVKKYHDRLNINKNVSIIDENVISLIKRETLDRIFDEYYKKENPVFLKLITDFSLKDDNEIKQYILTINNKLDLKYDKNDYLDSYLEKFYETQTINQRKEEYEALLKKKIGQIEDYLMELELHLDGDNYHQFLELFTPLLNAKDYDQIKSCLEMKLPRLPKNSSLEAKNLKENIQKLLDDLSDLCIFESSSTMINGYLSTKNSISIIIEIIKKLDQEIIKYKQEHSVFEFVDISKLAIDLMIKYPDVREETKSYFNEIMIDEYQDTSDLQEQFIQLIENNNVYMVGDMKQSIYRFRNANPAIFKKKYQDYSKEIGGLKIDLNKNFRSRMEVLENINQIFDLIMDNDFGGANYKESHRMNYGNVAYIHEGFTNQDYNLNILNYQLEKDSIYKKYTKDEIEAFIIATDIEKKIKEKYQVLDKNTNELRDIQYSDCVILMDRSSKFTLYKKIFEFMKIPLTVVRDENIMDQNEVYLIRNIFKLIECVEVNNFENSFRHSFVSIARSYLFRLTDQEIFHIINHNLYFESEIIQKIKHIISLLPRLSLSEMLSKIIEEFEFSQKLITIGNVQLGLSVLEYFLNLVEDLQNLGYDYHRFITYLDYIIQEKKEIKIPVSIGAEDSCQIMTIHKSKGLEYPICYYSGLSSSFNISDLKEKVLFDNEYGMIMPCFKNGYQDTFYKLLVKEKYLKEEINEKIRLFYVALTRCKEQMIIISNIDNIEEIDNSNLVLKKEKYHSFLDILRSVYETVQNYITPVSLENINITSEYKMGTVSKTLESKTISPLEVKEYEIDKKRKEETHFSKTVHELIDNKTKKDIKFGTKIHEFMEYTNFKNPNLEVLDDFKKTIITSFLKQPLLKNIQNANILKEYEFYITDEGENEKHGIIDLMLEYEDHIDIIDYKLKSVDDIAYLEQLKGYKKYIERKTNKKVYIYLYSIIDNFIKKIEET